MEELRKIIQEKFESAPLDGVFVFGWTFKEKSIEEVELLKSKEPGLSDALEIDFRYLDTNTEVFKKDYNISVTENGYLVAMTKQMAIEFYQQGIL